MWTFSSWRHFPEDLIDVLDILIVRLALRTSKIKHLNYKQWRFLKLLSSRHPRFRWEIWLRIEDRVRIAEVRSFLQYGSHLCTSRTKDAWPSLPSSISKVWCKNLCHTSEVNHWVLNLKFQSLEEVMYLLNLRWLGHISPVPTNHLPRCMLFSRNVRQWYHYVAEVLASRVDRVNLFRLLSCGPKDI